MLLRIIGYSLLCQHYLTVQSVECPYESLAQALVLCLRENTQEMSLASLPGSNPGGLARILTSLDSPQQILQETRVTIIARKPEPMNNIMGPCALCGLYYFQPRYLENPGPIALFLEREC